MNKKSLSSPLLPYFLSTVFFALLLLFPKLFFIVFPLTLSFTVARGLQAPIRVLERRFFIKRQLSSAIFVTLIFTSFFAVIFLLSKVLLREFSGVYLITRKFEGMFERFSFFEKIPFESDAFSKWVSEILRWVLSALGRFFEFFPSALVSLSVMIFSTFYIAKDYKIITDFFKKGVFKDIVVPIEKSLKDTFSRYFKAYFIVFLLSFAVIFLAFTLFKVPFPFALALILALLDMLPLFGCGAVFVPWCVLEFFRGNNLFAIKILIAYLFLFALREFIEPKILGSLAGVHPLIPFLSGVFGVTFFGFWGVLLFPLFSVFLYNLYKNENKKNRAVA